MNLIFTPFTLTTINIEQNITRSKGSTQTTNRDYDLVIKRLYLYYDMKLVTFGIDDQRNLIIQFPVIVQPDTQQNLILYQMETVPVPIIEKKPGKSYTYLKINNPYNCIKFRNIYVTENTRTGYRQKDRL